MPMPTTRLTFLIGTIAIAAGIAVATVLALSARGGDEVSLEGVTISELDLDGAELLVPKGDPVLSAEQAEDIVLSRRSTQFGDERDQPEVRETRLLRFLNETSNPPVDALAWAVNLQPETVPPVTPCPGICFRGGGPWNPNPSPTPKPTPLNCGPRTVYNIVFIAARTGEWLYETKSTELVVPEPGATCPPTPVITPTAMPNGQSGAPGEPPPALLKTSRELPVPADAIVDETNLYMGGSVLQSIHWSHQPVSQVVAFYEEHMSAAGWETYSIKEYESPADEKSAATTAAIAVFERGSTRVSLAVVEDTLKDPDRGTTRIGIAIEDRDLD